jgi:hypothetical protein
MQNCELFLIDKEYSAPQLSETRENYAAALQKEGEYDSPK